MSVVDLAVIQIAGSGTLQRALSFAMPLLAAMTPTPG